MDTSIFKAYDVRGVVPSELDAESARAIGAGFARFCDSAEIVVGYDMRTSSVELSEAFIEGVNSQGTSVISIGLCSTDMLYFASGRLAAPGAMFTASHNPAQYNGIKLCRSGAAPISSDSGLDAIKDFALAFLSGALPTVERSGVKNRKEEMLDDFVKHLHSFIDISSLKPLKVVCDTANGMGGLVVPAALDQLGLGLTFLYRELDGTFPNHPADPIQPENLIDLKSEVIARKADVGLAFDGDADRVFLVDDKAAPLSGSLTTLIVAKAILSSHPGATILYNLICSKAVPELISKLGGVPIRTRVGHSFIKSEMARTGAVFGGEHSGHYYFRDNYRADSGLVAALMILQVLSNSDESLSELRIPLETYASSGEVNTKVKDAGKVTEFIANAYSNRGTMDRLDGLTVDLGEWWFNVRPSNTEPLLRLNLEAKNPQEVASRLSEVLAVISKADR
jgi:phosphomannomutase